VNGDVHNTVATSKRPQRIRKPSKRKADAEELKRREKEQLDDPPDTPVDTPEPPPQSKGPSKQKAPKANSKRPPKKAEKATAKGA